MVSHSEILERQSPDSKVYVNQYTNGLIGPDVEWAGLVEDGGTVVAETAPGCFGPMITPSFRGPHEVTRPIAVENAAVGDALILEIESIDVKSIATSTGTHKVRDDAYVSDPGVDHKCPECGTPWPETYIDGVGGDSIKCSNCGAPASSYDIDFGYTMVFDEDYRVGLTLSDDSATKLAKNAHDVMAIPEHSKQHPVLTFKPSEVPGSLSRLSPFVGHIGTTPSITIPDSRNAGDFGQRLKGADHSYGIPETSDFAERTDAHMDINELREGSVVISPVKLNGGGVYLGDVHANQGDGELAMHTTDVSAQVKLKVSVVKNLHLDGPLVLPNIEDLPDIAKPFSDLEREIGHGLAEEYGEELQDDVAPLQVVGTGDNINSATQNSFQRASKLFDMSIGEVRTRSTFSGGVSVGRLPGVVQLSMLVPITIIEKLGIYDTVENQYST